MNKPLTDSELELAKARHMARTMDLVLGAMFNTETIFEQDVTCPMCGARELRHTRDAKAPGAVMAVCNRCSARDQHVPLDDRYV